MGKRVKLPGRAESAEMGGIVTGAGEILDDLKGKTQEVINTETDAELVRLDETKQGNLTFDQTPTENSTNPVTSGGVYAADQLLSQAIEAILLLIPSAASALNKLVDLNMMNSSISTATASFKGTYNLVSDLHLTVSATHAQIAAALDALSLGADNNDYAYVQVPNTDTAPTEIAKTERYKFNGTNWAYEYDLNNSGFTSAQWSAINSGITTLLVGKLLALPTNEALTLALAGKQNNLTFDNAPTAGSNNPVKSGGVYARNNEIVAMINALDAAKQDVLTFDSSPINGSTNPVTSNGVYLAISAVQAAIVALDAAKQNVLTFDSTPTLGSLNPATSSGIKTELNRIDGNITILNDLYEALTQSALVIIAPTDTWPVANPEEQTIYRVVDRTNTPPQYYSDYMWNGSVMVLMATYNNAIDDVPTAGSNNLVKSGGVYKQYFNGYYNSSAESPYSDLNDLPLGSVTTWGNLTGISNTPPTDSAAGGTVVCACGRNSWPTGAFQIFISPHFDHFSTAHIYFRQWWGDGSGWSQWNRVVNETDIPYMVAAIFNGHDPSGLTDLDNLPIGTVTSFTSFKSQNISNRPPIKDDVNVGGTVICTNARYNNSTCSTQICVTNYKDWNDTPHVYVRYKWGDGSGWSQWVRTANYSEIGMVPIGRAGSTYPNLNNLPLNTIAGYVLFTDIQNAPPVRGSWGGTVITTNCDSQDALKIQICISTKDDYNKTGHIYFRTLWGDGQGWTSWNRVVNYDEIDINYNSLSSFLRIGVVGDSFASGAVYMPGATVYTEYWSISWVQQLARINGSTGINYSSSGLYCKTWLTDAKGKAKLEADGACDLYYLALGINDSNNTATQPLGTIADIHDGNPSQNADSFYGNYGRIVEIIKAHAPNAKIIFSTMANNSGTKATFNTAIVEIASHYDIPVIKQYEDGFFTSDYYLNHMIQGHPTVQVYGGMAKAIERLTKKCMLNNITYFNDIQPTSVGQP